MDGLRASEAEQKPIGAGWRDQRYGAKGKQVQACKDNDRKSKGLY